MSVLFKEPEVIGMISHVKGRLSGYNYTCLPFQPGPKADSLAAPEDSVVLPPIYAILS